MFFRNAFSKLGRLVAAAAGFLGFGDTADPKAGNPVTAPKSTREIPFSISRAAPAANRRNRISTRANLPPGKYSRKISTCARNANVYGTQSFAGKSFISYAEHDRQTRQRLLSQATFG